MGSVKPPLLERWGALVVRNRWLALALTTLFIVGQCFRDAGATDEARAVLERFLVAFGEDGNPAIRDEVRGWLSALQTRPS